MPHYHLDPAASAAAELLRLNKMPSAQAIEKRIKRYAAASLVAPANLLIEFQFFQPTASYLQAWHFPRFSRFAIPKAMTPTILGTSSYLT